MLSSYSYPKFEYLRPSTLSSDVTQHCALVVVGAGPVGLAAAIDLAQQGLQVLLLDDDNTVSIGSRGVCYAKRSVEVLDRLGVGKAVVDKGVTWNVGRTFCQEGEVYSFNLLPEPEQERPGMINLQQYYLEEFLVRRAQSMANIDLRWSSKVTQVQAQDSGALLEVTTPDGVYRLQTDWLVVADGARSPIRRMMGLETEGKVFQDRFLIADVVMKADFPAERWFWFDPPFHRNQSVLLHRQADNVWRIDFQLGWDADPEEEKKPERVLPRIKAMLGDDREFELEWVSIYTFQCRRMSAFRHGRVLFAGDAAHQVSPFGARGANSGLQDVDNLAWKLKLVIDGKAHEGLLDSYCEERGAAADENLLNSTRSTDFITPKSAVSKLFRNAVLGLAREHPFARALVNSGRLSVPAHYTRSSLNTADVDSFEGQMSPGAPMLDAPVQMDGRDTWLLRHTGGQFTLLMFVDDTNLLGKETQTQMQELALLEVPVRAVLISKQVASGYGLTSVLHDVRGLAMLRYDASPGTCYLIRPDQHVAARWRRYDAMAIHAALAHACQAVHSFA